MIYFQAFHFQAGFASINDEQRSLDLQSISKNTIIAFVQIALVRTRSSFGSPRRKIYAPVVDNSAINE